MQPTRLNEHDANQGAQSAGEFLGMSGNSGWYLLGAAGATVLIVVLLWGMFGVPLVLCLFAGLVLCALSVAYVFGLKNNKPAHYDTDYFEAALVEAGVCDLSFGPRARRPTNPFGDHGAAMVETKPPVRSSSATGSVSRGQPGKGTPAAVPADTKESGAPAREQGSDRTPMVTRVAYERLEEKLTSTEETLEEVLAEHGED